MDVRASISEWDKAAWRLAAVAVGFSDRDDETARAAREVLAATGVELPDGATAEQVSGHAAAPLLQAAAVVRGGSAWDGLPDEALVAQGRASGQAARLFAAHVFPRLPGLSDALSRPGARMLDVGTGIGHLAAGFLAAYPDLHVVGLDVMPRVLALAEAAGHGPRFELRLQDVAQLDEESAYDLGWLPAPFLPEAALRAGVPRAVRALRPGGWLLMAVGRQPSEPGELALHRFVLSAYGGTGLDAPTATAMLRDAGLTDVTVVDDLPPGAPALAVGRRA